MSDYSDWTNQAIEDKLNQLHGFTIRYSLSDEAKDSAEKLEKNLKAERTRRWIADHRRHGR